jgi:Baseplate J-like protein
MLQLQSFVTLIQNMAAAVQSSASALLNLTTGSVLRAILEANASVALWLQWLILQVLSLTRLATSSGNDVDTFVGDYAQMRLPAVASSGPEVFGRYSTTNPAFVPVDGQVKTNDGTRIYQVIADSTNAAFNGISGFVLAPGVASIVCTVVDITTDANGNPSIGVAGNVQPNTITLPASSMTGIDFVNNTVPFNNGINAESDPALKLRFKNYIQTRSRATLPAVEYAITSVQQALDYTVQENVATDGSYRPGNFVVTVDDGTGSPPSSLLASVSAAIATYRPIGSTWSVQAPSVVTATISMTITTNPTANKPGLMAPVQAALLAYVDRLPDGATLPYSRLPMIAYLVDPSIIDVTAALLNGGTSDLAPGVGGVIKATTGSVTVT